ncbi:MAG: hypothetical protein FWF26_03345 [Treponema sp.]|nr:hypothetical protein [Treponema sp.]
MTVEELRLELEKTISGLASSGFGSIDSATVEKLDNFSITAGELGMKEGKHLIENLSGAMKAIQEGKSKAESGSIRLTALDFYVKKLSGGGNIEDL